MSLVRDNWEYKQSEVEERLSSILSTPWKAAIDVSILYSYTNEDNSYARTCLGQAIFECVMTPSCSLKHA